MLRPFLALALVTGAAILLPCRAVAGDGGTATCCSAAAPAPAERSDAATPPPAEQTEQEKRWGIKITSMRLSAQGYMVDFRYRVLDPEKAATLADRELKPYLLDVASGKKLTVPRTPKVGPMRQTAVKVETGRVYSALFANPAHLVKAGSQVSVVIGECRLENLTVE